MKMILTIRNWLLRTLARGRPIVLNVKVNGTISMPLCDKWGYISGCLIDGSTGAVAITTLPVSAGVGNDP